MAKKLYRSRNDRVISGVCAGLGQYLDIDPTLLRIAAALLAIWSFGTAILVYLALAIIVPIAPEGEIVSRDDGDVITQ
ncbi:MAG: PspC domain-containing protein [Anaerolineae bacterium]|nr:PspC domain-containing protein [Anaerolineae bacterium]MCB9132768.1 PspC domain-containing protein [Anaerolineales bacterium]MCB0228198.1 PspC domain-containing protein [Anaerolineae bacterium]MCB0233521.1 PspC domain-containing protein [Anaerolineae bacterium]MCB0237125.1 PspC domain-containing protein [Anaerolineae bacterium]